MTEPKGTTGVTWECDKCGTEVTIVRTLRLGESAADQAAANTDDLEAIRKRHTHTKGNSDG